MLPVTPMVRCGPPYLFCAKVAPESARGKVREFLEFFYKGNARNFLFFFCAGPQTANLNWAIFTSCPGENRFSKTKPNGEVRTQSCPPGAGECNGEDIGTFGQLSARVRQKERKIPFLQRGAPLDKRLSEGGRWSECRGVCMGGGGGHRPPGSPGVLYRGGPGWW